MVIIVMNDCTFRRLLMVDNSINEGNN